jgi:Na+/H+ antiporter NhaD/arsenite permease-like protein
VYFGGLTYLGNAPNLVAKAIVESQGLRMPGFFGYIGWALVFPRPWLMLVEALFLH